MALICSLATGQTVGKVGNKNIFAFGVAHPSVGYCTDVYYIIAAVIL